MHPRTSPEIPSNRSAIAPAGLSVGDFAKLAGVSRSLVYGLAPALQPRSVKVGRRRLVFEAPADWLARLAEAQS